MNYQPGQVDLKSLSLFNHKGQEISIIASTVELNIYNDINVAGTSVELVFVDGIGLVNAFPIVGDELLVVSFKTPDMEDHKFEKIDYVFKITSIHSREREDVRSETFVLQGFSLEVINNITKSVNKSYTNLTVDKIVKAVHNGFIKPFKHPILEQLDNRKASTLVTQTKTLGEKTFVFPGVDPFKVINQLSNEAEVDPSLDISSGNNFKYFQNSRGWHFITTDLLTKQDPKEQFVYAESSVPVDEFDKSQKIKSFKIEETPDQITNVLNGVYNQIVETIDPITKQYTVDKFNYAKNRKKFTHVEKDKFSLISKNSSYADEFDTGKSIYVVSNIGNNYSNLDYIKNASQGDVPSDYQMKNPRTVHKNIKFKNPYKNSFNIKVTINIPGNTNLEIGDTIELTVPQPGQDKTEMKKSDKGLGKKYLITSLRHVLTVSEGEKDFFTSLRLEKNNYGFDLEPVE